MKQLFLFLVFIALFDHIYSAEIIKPTKKSRAIAGEYIVQLNKGVNVRDFVRTKSFRSKSGDVVALEQNVKRMHEKLINGFSVRLSDEQVLELNSMPEVKRISYNGYTTMASVVTDDDAPWDLARLSKYYSLPSTGPWAYSYDNSAGYEVNVYILDTGIDDSNAEFAYGNVWKYLSIDGFDNSVITDYHGTAVASLVGGVTCGVANGAWLNDIKVANDSGSVEYDDIISGMEAADGDYWNYYVFEPAIILISIETDDYYPTLDDAIESIFFEDCIVVVVPAGNDGDTSACDESPAKADFAITVGATDIYDSRWSYSNFGKCVDLYAPGYLVNIAGESGVTTGSGTSYSAAIVAGLAAYNIRLYDVCACEEVWDILLYYSDYRLLYMPEYSMNRAGLALNNVGWVSDTRKSMSPKFDHSIFNRTNLIEHNKKNTKRANVSARDNKKMKQEFKKFVRSRPDLLERLPSSKFNKN